MLGDHKQVMQNCYKRACNCFTAMLHIVDMFVYQHVAQKFTSCKVPTLMVWAYNTASCSS